MKLSLKQSLLIIFSFFFFLFLLLFLSGRPEQSSSPLSKSTQIIPIGTEAFLRLSANNDPEQILLLAPTPEIWDEIGKAFLAKDYYGLLIDLAPKGVFGVSNGTKILIIDKQGIVTPLYRVRILKGVRPIDEDKIGRSGWLPSEFISSN
jgi:hypothetical protein